MPNVYVIAGCNGAGKTTASYTILPEILNCREFVNADEIARGLSPFQPETVAFEAGRIMLNRIRELMAQQVDFAFETTLSTRSYAALVKKAQEQGYHVILIFFWLNSIELAQERVKHRVSKGGHHIPELVIERRYNRGLRNFFDLYQKLVDTWVLYDNSEEKPVLIASNISGMDISIFNHDLWARISATTT